VTALIFLACLMIPWKILVPSPAGIQAGVFLTDRRVGTMGYLDGNTWFSYEDRDPLHPVLGQTFESDPDRLRRATSTVPAWFANLLPEPGSGLRQLIAQEIGRKNPHDFQVLTYLGKDLPGAVRVIADSDMRHVPELAREGGTSGDHRIRFSLAGIQPKFSMQWQGRGLTLPMSGEGGDWIVKLPDGRFRDLPANEYSMLYWARLAGIDVPEIRLMEGSYLSGLPSGLIKDDELAFCIRRFDRDVSERIHQEDFAQIRDVSPEQKYDRATYSGIGRIVQSICPEDFQEYVRRLAAIVVMGNNDAHLKNWTIQYPDGRTARLSPAYDFVSVSAYGEFRDQALAFTIDGGHRADTVSYHNFEIFAQRVGVSPEIVSDTVSKTTSSMVACWPQVKAECDVPNFVSSHIEDRLRRLPLIRSRP
jgi:serine/threonine-protein kinase HipA